MSVAPTFCGPNILAGWLHNHSKVSHSKAPVGVGDNETKRPLGMPQSPGHRDGGKTLSQRNMITFRTKYIN
ncbi:hypothetical protein E2C01_088810 [Portunus trituberculatus]|uniref:Uncharacterized protein n=1 Tax=Portunus trituberculatus TaxID=210409 RepID=A0A5B7JBT7_PORTR|nr:hypothetical protein [Portunus trituberculatus]